MKIGRLLTMMCFACVIGACSKDDDRDDTVLDISRLTGKYWYYNAWLGDKYDIFRPDILEVVCLEKGGILKTMDFSGRQEYIAGKWSGKDNKIILEYEDGNSMEWDVLRSGDDYIKVIVNAQGEREYTTDLGYLGHLTADAFLVNEYTSGNRFQTYIGVDVRGNNNVREGDLIVSDGKNIPLENHGYWSVRKPLQGDYFDFDAKSRSVRFYLRMGKDTQLKLQDSIYAENLPERIPAEVNLSASNQQGTLRVDWLPYDKQDIYYRVEVFSKNMDLTKPYFVSRVQPVKSTGLNIKPTTAGEINRISELVTGETYGIRLTALLYEPEVDVVNDEYSYANVQAVTYFTGQFLWK